MAYEIGPYDRVHGYVQFGGNLPGAEEWSCGIRVACTEGIDLPGGGADNWDMNVLINHYETALVAWFKRPDSHISNRATLEFVKFNKIAVTGLYVEPITYQRHPFPVPAGNNGSGGVPCPPNQICCAISLLTGVTRGPAHRGRFYSPLPNVEAQSDGLIEASVAGQIAASAKTLLEDMSDTPGIDTASDPGVVVMSRKKFAPTTRRVTGVEVGRVLDTQRRRRRSLPETYSFGPVEQGVF